MRTICIKTKLRPEYIEEVRLWFKTLLNRYEETMETLKIEGVLVESAFIDRQGDDIFLIYYLKAENIEKAYEIFDKSQLPIEYLLQNMLEKILSRERGLGRVDRFGKILNEATFVISTRISHTYV